MYPIELNFNRSKGELILFSFVISPLLSLHSSLALLTPSSFHLFFLLCPFSLSRPLCPLILLCSTLHPPLSLFVPFLAPYLPHHFMQHLRPHITPSTLCIPLPPPLFVPSSCLLLYSLFLSPFVISFFLSSLSF